MLLAATVLVPTAIAGRYSPAPTPTTPSAQRVVVRTELVPEGDKFDWLDAAAGFGLAIVSVAIVLLVLAGLRPRVRSAEN